MAQPSTETQTFRSGVTQLLSNLQGANGVERLLHIIEDQGTDDTERQAFFEAYLLDGNGDPVTDIEWAEFSAAIVVLRDLRTWLATNARWQKLATLRI